jgi:uncharacterized protein
MTIEPMSQHPVIVIVPGWRNSGPGHWQTLWANTLPGAVRVEQDDWITPVRSAWVNAIGKTILSQSGPVILVAHSLGCIASTHLSELVTNKIVGGLFVAPANPERRAPLIDFAPVHHEKLPYRSIVVGSSNDPFCPSRVAGAYARSWGSDFVRLMDVGHINVDSGHGNWPLGLHLLNSLIEGIAMDRSIQLKCA